MSESENLAEEFLQKRRNAVSLRPESFLGKVFYLENAYGDIIGRTRFSSDGKLEGYSSKNERSWSLDSEGALCLLDRRGKITSRFSCADEYGTLWAESRTLRKIEPFGQQFTGAKLHLPDVTLVCADCYDIKRAITAIETSRYFCEFGDIKLFSSIESDYAYRVGIPRLGSTRDYSRFMLLDLARHIRTKYFLVVQHDGFICNPAAWSDDWYNYDYIGGKVPYGVEFWRGVRFGGCGGFSFRSTRLQTYIAENCDWNTIDPYYHHEDYVICVTFGYQLGAAGFKLYPNDLARQRFSGEEHQQYLGQFGHHKGDLSTWQLKPQKI